MTDAWALVLEARLLARREARRWSASRDEADDAEQAAMVELHRVACAGGFRADRGTFVGYAHRAVRGCVWRSLVRRRNVMRAPPGVSLISFDEPLVDDSDRTLADVIEDPCSPDLVAALGLEVTRARVRAALAVLSRRERTVVEVRFDLDDEHAGNGSHGGWTVPEVATLLGMTPAGVSAAETRALRKLYAALRVDLERS